MSPKFSAILFSLFALLIMLLCFSFKNNSNQKNKQSVDFKSAYFFLSAFGVEADGFPTISATIDFENRKATCEVSYYEPQYKPRQYNLSSKEIDTLLNLINHIDWKNFKKDYAVGRTDQPTSTVTIKTSQDEFIIKDYGLEGDAPLPELYRIVYKLEQTFKH